MVKSMLLSDTVVPGRKRAFWAKKLHQWHWISSAICLIGMLFFALTGITLNHATLIPSDSQAEVREVPLSNEVGLVLSVLPREGSAPLPDGLRRWAETALLIDLDTVSAEFSEDEIYVSLPRPGGDAWLSIDRHGKTARYEESRRGWISWLNDLHKGRHTGLAWVIFLDVFSAACVVFCVTGLLLLRLHAGCRPMTWPTVGLGLAMPVLLLILFVH